jgi:hypothetical protein
MYSTDDLQSDITRWINDNNHLFIKESYATGKRTWINNNEKAIGRLLADDTAYIACRALKKFLWDKGLPVTDAIKYLKQSRIFIGSANHYTENRWFSSSPRPITRRCYHFKLK